MVSFDKIKKLTPRDDSSGMVDISTQNGETVSVGPCNPADVDVLSADNILIRRFTLDRFTGYKEIEFDDNPVANGARKVHRPMPRAELRCRSRRG